MKKALWLLVATLCASVAWSADPGPAASNDTEMMRERDLVASKNSKAAPPALAPYVKANPSSAYGHNLLGYSLGHLMKYDESLAAYHHALKLNPRHMGAHEYIGVAYLEMKHPEKAASTWPHWTRFAVSPARNTAT